MPTQMYPLICKKQTDKLFRIYLIFYRGAKDWSLGVCHHFAYNPEPCRPYPYTLPYKHFFNVVCQDIQQLRVDHCAGQNLSPQERRTIIKLQDIPDVVIKEAAVSKY